MIARSFKTLSWLRQHPARLVPLVALCALCGCGTTKWSDSPRTATEQLLVSDAIDRAISEIDFSALADKNVYLDTRFIITAIDQNYVQSTLRQHMLASGCIIKDKPEDATYVVEVRAGSLGTNRQDLLFGVPATTLPSAGMLPVGSASIPEIALMKRTNQQGVCKIAVFAYDRMSGRPVWQSGNRKIASRAKDVWVMGAGPFQRGTIYEGTAFAGERLQVPLVGKGAPEPLPTSVANQRVFPYLDPQVNPSKVESAGFLQPLPDTNPKPDAPKSDAPKDGAPPAPKAAYTPPLPSAPPPLPPPAFAGPQGNLPMQNTVPTAANPAAAIQTYTWAKDMLEQRKQE